METLTATTVTTQQIATALNSLLANYQIHYQNLRGFHWNIQGPQFFDLHAKFEELYTESAEHIDEVAERILALDQRPLHTFQAYLNEAEIKVYQDVHDAQTSVRAIVEGLQVLVQIEKHILQLASAAEDEGTASLVSDLIKGHEKNIWMFKAYLQ